MQSAYTRVHNQYKLSHKSTYKANANDKTTLHKSHRYTMKPLTYLKVLIHETLDACGICAIEWILKYSFKTKLSLPAIKFDEMPGAHDFADVK
jgi:hypothetical protein